MDVLAKFLLVLSENARSIRSEPSSEGVPNALALFGPGRPN